MATVAIVQLWSLDCKFPGSQRLLPGIKQVLKKHLWFENIIKPIFKLVELKLELTK